MSQFKTVIETIEEMVHYPSSKMVYQKDNKFTDISIANIERMNVLHKNDEYIFVHRGVSGYVFSLMDIDEVRGNDKAVQEVKPVLHVHLRPSVGGFKQAHNLRIREDHSGNNLAKVWYMNYINQIEPIVSDKDHLEGGYRLWKSFIDTASRSAEYEIKMVDTNDGSVLMDSVTNEVPDDQIWSEHTKENKDQSKSNIVLVFGKKGFSV
jgi:hypothetical protein